MRDPALPAPVRAAPAHPLVLGAAALIVANDFVLRGHAPGWLTGKLSDVGWLVVAPVLIAAVVSRCGAPRAAKAAGLAIAGGFYTALQLWPPLGAWINPGHVADLGDLLVLPAILGAVVAWRSPHRSGWLGLAALPLLGGVLVADDYSLFSPSSTPCGEAMTWNAVAPFQLRMSALAVPVDSHDFLAGLRLTDADAVEVPLVAAAQSDGGSVVLVCARDGLRGDTDYTWEIGPWHDDVASNEVGFWHDALPTVRFRTAAWDGVPAADAEACRALEVDLGVAVDQCSTGEPRPDTGAADTGADTGDSGGS